MRIVIAAVLACAAVAAPARAFEWTLEPSLFMGGVFPGDDAWNELMGGADLAGYGFALDSTIYKGFGAYIAYGAYEADHKYRDEVDVEFSDIGTGVGVQYRHAVTKWFEPGARLGMSFHAFDQRIKDDHLEIRQDASSAGYDLAVEMNFYPFASLGRRLHPEQKDASGGSVRRESWAAGWRIYGAGTYRYVTIDGFGDLDDASGPGYEIGFGYRFRFGRDKDAAPSGAPADTPQTPAHAVTTQDKTDVSAPEPTPEPESENEPEAEPAPGGPGREIWRASRRGIAH
ncbi:hypothetical protein K8I61_17530 [bacterium]|nr:hypothetical protein [bacterium]